MQKPNYSGRADRSPRGVARRNGVSTGTIYKEIREGRLKGKKIGARTIITNQQEQAWIDHLPEVGDA